MIGSVSGGSGGASGGSGGHSTAMGASNNASSNNNATNVTNPPGIPSINSQNVMFLLPRYVLHFSFYIYARAYTHTEVIIKYNVSLFLLILINMVLNICINM